MERKNMKIRKYSKKDSDRIHDRVDELTGVKQRNEFIDTLLEKDSMGNYTHSLDAFLK
jgi:hypothetical protein